MGLIWVWVFVLVFSVLVRERLLLRRGGLWVGVPGLAEADMDLGVVGGGLGVGVAVLLNI